MSNLGGKVAVITGSSKGIGAAIAERLWKDGASVVVNYSRSADFAEAVVQRNKSSGGRAVAIQADVSNPSEIAKLFSMTMEAFGGLDILVNNAGIYKFAPLAEITVDHIDQHFNLNVKAMLLVTQAAVPLFGPDGGVVINMSSGIALTPRQSSAVYSCTKAAVDVTTRVLALELGPRKIRVVGIAPGLTATEGLSEMEAVDKSATEYAISRTPLVRLGKAEDIANAVAFLASADASWVTGDTLQVGGGLRF